MFEILGNVLDIGQCNVYSAIYALLGFVWNTGQYMGYWQMSGILGNIYDLGDVWEIGNV